MARSNVEVARDAIYQLFNVADHVAKCAENARAALEGSEPWKAEERLKDSERSADLFGMRWQDAIDALRGKL